MATDDRFMVVVLIRNDYKLSSGNHEGASFINTITLLIIQQFKLRYCRSDKFYNFFVSNYFDVKVCSQFYL